VSRKSDPWRSARTIARATCAAFLLTGFIGEGLFTSIPFTPLLFLLIGWLAVPERRPAAAPVAERPAVLPQIPASPHPAGA
jgi:hypothetical protein